MVDPERDKLSDVVEIDETFVGGVVRRTSTKKSIDKKKYFVLITIELAEP